MGKRRVVKKTGELGREGKQAESNALSRRRLEHGVLHVEATYNNTKVLLADKGGNTITWSSSGHLGFSGAKRGTPFAAAKVGEMMADRAKQIGLKEIDVIIRGVGSGRESAVRAFVTRSGVAINTIQDRTPIPFNGPRPAKPRRV